MKYVQITQQSGRSSVVIKRGETEAQRGKEDSNVSLTFCTGNFGVY